MMFRRKNKLQFTEDAAKVEKMYGEKEREVAEIKKQQKMIKREKGIVAIMAVLGMMGLMGFALYLLLLIPLPENSFAKIIPWAIYILVLLPLFGWLILLINRHIYGD